MKNWKGHKKRNFAWTLPWIGPSPTTPLHLVSPNSLIRPPSFLDRVESLRSAVEALLVVVEPSRMISETRLTFRLTRPNTLVRLAESLSVFPVVPVKLPTDLRTPPNVVIAPLATRPLPLTLRRDPLTRL